MLSRPAVAYRCSSCTRCFVALDEPSTGEILCACGAPLSARRLPQGMYELRSTEPDDGRPTLDLTPFRMERDVGYGASHGNGLTHGGPTGPGDAPASLPGDRH